MSGNIQLATPTASEVVNSQRTSGRLCGLCQMTIRIHHTCTGCYHIKRESSGINTGRSRCSLLQSVPDEETVQPVSRLGIRAVLRTVHLRRYLVSGRQRVRATADGCRDQKGFGIRDSGFGVGSKGVRNSGFGIRDSGNSQLPTSRISCVSTREAEYVRR